MQLSPEEIRRKLLHLLALLMPVCIFYSAKWSFPPVLVPLLLFLLFTVSMVVELLRFKVPSIQKFVLNSFGPMMRKEEHFDKISGSTWVIGAAFFCSILFRGFPYVSFIVLTLFITGDAVAALVGISIGRIKIGKKSLEGSLACLGLCLVFFYVVFPYVPGILEHFGGGNKIPPLIIWVTSIVITVFELVPLKVAPKLIINDNLAVPIIAGVVMIFIERFT